MSIRVLNQVPVSLRHQTVHMDLRPSLRVTKRIGHVVANPALMFRVPASKLIPETDYSY